MSPSDLAERFAARVETRGGVPARDEQVKPLTGLLRELTRPALHDERASASERVEEEGAGL